MKSSDYYYAVTRVHSHELCLLSSADLEQLLQAPSLEDCFELLKNKGWGDASLPELDAFALLEYEYKKIWELMEELVGNIEFFNVFRYSHDFNNLKAAIKLAYSNRGEDNIDRYVMPFGTVDVSVIMDAARKWDFSQLPEPMNTAGEAAYQALVNTGSGQYCDVIIDKASVEKIYDTAIETKNQLLMDYGTLTADLANLKTAIRGHFLNKSGDFYDLALADRGSFTVDELKKAALGGIEQIYTLIGFSRYNEGLPALQESLAAFESWCGDQLMKAIRPQRHAIGGIEPLAAFVLARENEINMVRLVLSAKENDLDTEKVRQRMREMYV